MAVLGGVERKVSRVQTDDKTRLANLTEYDTLANRQELIQGHEDIVFVVFVSAIHVKLLNALH
jgi:hypothetical protein